MIECWKRKGNVTFLVDRIVISDQGVREEIRAVLQGADEWKKVESRLPFEFQKNNGTVALWQRGRPVLIECGMG